MRRFTILIALTLLLHPEASASSSSGQLLYSRQLARQDDLFLIDVATGRTKQITNHAAKDSHGAFSPDGGRIVFNSERRGWWKIWIMDSDGGQIEQLTNPSGGADYYPVFSPDGREIVFASGTAGNGDIFVMAADGSRPRNLTDHPARDNFPVYSPDGKRIAFASDRDGPWAIYVMSIDGSGVERVTQEGEAIEPDWLPDGSGLLYQSTRGNADENFDLWMLKLETGEQSRLTQSSFSDERPAVSPDGRWVAFESDRAGGSQIFLISIDGGDVRQLTREGYCYGARWRPAED